MAAAVLDLHAPVEPAPPNHAHEVQCHGCEAEGYDREWPPWPCATVQRVAAVLDVALPTPGSLDLTYNPDTRKYERP